MCISGPYRKRDGGDAESQIVGESFPDQLRVSQGYFQVWQQA